jgi:hypothetical protein
MVTSRYIGAHQQYVTYLAMLSASLTIANVTRSMLQDALTFFWSDLIFGLPLPSLSPSSSLLLLSPLLSLSPTTLLPLPLRMLLLLPLLAHRPCCCSLCFLCHRKLHRRLIAVSKRWAKATAAAMAALRATTLGDCGGSSSNEDGCRNSQGKDYGIGGNGVGDDCP